MRDLKDDAKAALIVIRKKKEKFGLVDKWVADPEYKSTTQQIVDQVMKEPDIIFMVNGKIIKGEPF